MGGGFEGEGGGFIGDDGGIIVVFNFFFVFVFFWCMIICMIGSFFRLFWLLLSEYVKLVRYVMC